MFLRCSNQKSTSLLFLSFSFIALVDLRTSPGPAPAFLLAKYLKIQPHASELATTLPNAWRHNIPQSQRHLGDLSISVRARCLGKQNLVLDTDQLSPTIIISASPSRKPVSGGMPQPSQSDTRGRLPVHSRNFRNDGEWTCCSGRCFAKLLGQIIQWMRSFDWANSAEECFRPDHLISGLHSDYSSTNANGRGDLPVKPPKQTSKLDVRYVWISRCTSNGKRIETCPFRIKHRSIISASANPDVIFWVWAIRSQ